MNKQQFYIVLLHIGTINRSSFHKMPKENLEIIIGLNFSSHLWPADLILVPGVGNIGRAEQSFPPTICFSQYRRVGGKRRQKKCQRECSTKFFPPLCLLKFILAFWPKNFPINGTRFLDYCQVCIFLENLRSSVGCGVAQLVAGLIQAPAKRGTQCTRTVQYSTKREAMKKI